MPPIFWLGGLFSAGWIVLGHVGELSFLVRNLPIFLFFAVVSIRTGQLFLTMENMGVIGRQLTGWSFILWGLHRADYPYLATVEMLAPWRLLLSSLLALAMAIGMLILYFERIRLTLTASEERFRTLVEQATDGMFLLDLDGRILDANRHACQSLGYSKEELLQLNLQDIVAGLTDIILPHGSDRFTPGVPSTLEGRHLRRDGSSFPVDIRISVIEPSGSELQLLALARDVSKQKETEALLRQSSRKFEGLYNQSFQLIALLSPDGILLDANQTAVQLGNGELARSQGAPFWEAAWWNQDPKQQSALRQAVERTARGEVVRLETHFPDEQGTQLTVDFSLKPITDETGQVQLLIAEGRDITDRIIVANALRTSNNALETLFEANPIPLVAIDKNGHVTRWNQAAEQTFGWRQDEVIGRPCPLQLQCEAASKAELLRRVFAKESLRGIEVTGQRQDGSILELNLYGSPLCNEQGDVCGAMGIFVDLSERKQAETHLRESESRYRKLFQQFETLLNAISDPIILVSPEMKIIWSNRRSEQDRKPELSSLPGKPCYRQQYNRDTICPECPVIDCFRTGEFQERVIVTPDNRSWGVKVFPVKNKAGTVVNVLEISTDITEKIRLRDEAERNNRLAALGELAAGVAHEINNPNGLILLNLPILMEAYVDSEPILAEFARTQQDFIYGGLPFSRMRHEIPEMLAEMRDGAERIKRIVDDLKNFVRQDTLSDCHKVDLNQSLQTAVRLTSNEIKRATNRFTISYAADLRPIQGISLRLEQVLVNLIINACQALPNKNCSLTVSTRYDADSDRNVIEVRDEGKGIEEKDLRRLTDPFFTTRRENGGTGLGLSVSARIVKEHGGELHFASTPGKGTTATLLLPPMKGPQP
ncbi:MAG: PAS domain S-box protein [Desulfuromonadaceae bacterium]